MYFFVSAEPVVKWVRTVFFNSTNIHMLQHGTQPSDQRSEVATHRAAIAPLLRGANEAVRG